MENKRVRIKPKGIKRSTPITASEDGNCSEIINMRLKDGAWRAVTDKQHYHANAVSLLALCSIIRKHPMMDDKYLIGCDADNNILLIDLDEGTSTNIHTNINSEEENNNVEDVFIFGRLLIVSTVVSKLHYKLNSDNESFVYLPPLPQGQHAFWQNQVAYEDKTLLAATSDENDQVAAVKKIIYDDRVLGKFEGHTFFRLAWRLTDNTLIFHSAVHYHHIGLYDGYMCIDYSVDPRVLKNYYAAKPYVRISFALAELQVLEKYKNIVTGLVLFMSDPISSYSEEWEMTESPDTYKPKPNPNAADLLKEVKGFYKIHEYSIDDILAFEQDEAIGNGMYVDLREIEVNDVNSIESNERLTLDAYTNHALKGGCSYDYNSSVHLGNVTTIFSKCQNMGKYYLINGGSAAQKTLIYGENRNIIFAPFSGSGAGNCNVEVFVPLTNYHTNGGLIRPYKVIFSYDETDPSNSYDTTEGVYVVQAGNYGIFNISFSGDVTNSTTYLYGSKLVVDIMNGSALLHRTTWTVPAETTETYAFDVSTTSYLNDGDIIWIKVYHADDKISSILGGCWVDNPAELNVVKTSDATTFEFNLLLEVEIETDDGTKINRFWSTITTAYQYGVTMYYDSVLGLFYLMFKEYITYPDLRAKKIRVLAYDEGEQDYFLIRTFYLSAHPYLDFSYAKPEYNNGANLYYTPHLIELPSAITTMPQYTPPDEDNLLHDKNRVQVSLVNNAFLYPARYSYRIGTTSNEVMRIATMSEPMSQGQYGQFPLNVFSTQGIFNLNQGSNGILYGSISRLNLDRLLSKDALVELGGAIIYATPVGLFLLAGTNRKEISRDIEGGVNLVYNRIDKWKLPDTETEVINIEVFTYGYAYNQHAVLDERNIAPQGWRVPSDDEWKNLEEAIGMSPTELDNISWRGTTEGGKLKSTRVYPTDVEPRWNTPNTGATDEYGFCALPAGYKDEVNYFGVTAHFWTSTPYVNRSISNAYAQISRETSSSPYNGLSVRCIQDKETGDVEGDTGFGIDNDGNYFSWVVIGDYRWMKENLRSKKFRNSETIPYVQEYTAWTALTSAARTSHYSETDTLVIIDNSEILIHNIFNHFSNSDFITYMQNAKLAYNHNDLELLVCNTQKNYSYVYQVEQNVWHKITNVYKQFFTINGNEYVGIDADGNTFRINDNDTYSDKMVGLLTRPMLLTSDNLKKIERLITRIINNSSESETAVNLFVSLDGRVFTWLAGVSVSNSGVTIDDMIIKRTHTSARYFIVSFGTVASEVFELTAFDIEMQQKHQSKLR